MNHTDDAVLLPHLARRGASTQFIVDGKPFLALGGALHNSSFASLDYMAPILARFAAGHLNTALVAVYWDRIEPEEGRFDFSLVDDAIRLAQRNSLRLVLLWFKSWKNGVSTYPPVWAKTDLRRFPRAQNREGRSLEILSTLSDANSGRRCAHLCRTHAARPRGGQRLRPQPPMGGRPYPPRRQGPVPFRRLRPSRHLCARQDRRTEVADYQPQRKTHETTQ